MRLVLVHALFACAACHQRVGCLIPTEDCGGILIVLLRYLVRFVYDCDLIRIDDCLADKAAELVVSDLVIQSSFPVGAVVVLPHRTGNDIIHAVDRDDVGKNIGDRTNLVYGFVVMSPESKCVTEVVSADADI